MVHALFCSEAHVGRFHRRLLALFLICFASSSLCAGPALVDDVIVTGLNHPWNIAFLPDGRWLVTERGGQLRVVRDGQLQPKPIAGVPPVYAASQGGLFDVLPAADFAMSRRLYLSFAHGSPSANGTRVVRAELNGGALESVTPIFTALPLKNTPVHYGGRLAWHNDGTLILTLGDGFDFREEAQKVDSHLGTIVRLHTDGRVPDDNPLQNKAGALPEIYTWGHRNVQGIAVDRASDRIFIHEHGPRGGDELNLILPGRNYGWPAITYGVDYSGALVSPYTELPGMEQPLVHWTPSIAPSDMTLYRGTLFPAWRGDLLIASLVERSVRRIDLDDRGRVLAQQIVYQSDDRIRGVREAPDGSVILLVDDRDADDGNGRLVRLRPSSPGS